MVTVTDVLWAFIGLFLTIGGTLIEAFTTNAPWTWSQGGIAAQSLGISYQVGAVLLTGCLGGKTAGAIAQIAYLTLGLLWFNVFGLQIFDQGGGLNYIYTPSFGYLLGFIPAAWVAGFIAYPQRPKLEIFGLACMAGLAVMHGVGLAYLTLAAAIGWLAPTGLNWWEAVWVFSVLRIPGQIALSCVVAVLAYGIRRLLLY